jgi:hypothetical protein
MRSKIRCMELWDLFLIWVPLAISIMVGLSCGVVTLVPADFRLARALAWASGILGIVFAVNCALRLNSDPWLRVVLGLGLCALVAIYLMAALRWIGNRENLARRQPSSIGVLRPTKIRSLVKGNDLEKNIRIEIGRSGAILTNHGPLDDVLAIWGLDQFNVEMVDEKIKVSTIIRNENGSVITELYRNEWKVGSPPLSWDRNYTEDTLEVRNDKGHVVLQVRVSSNIVQIQGVWPYPKNPKLLMVVRETPEREVRERYTGQITFYDPNDPSAKWPDISPLFHYPSETHLGELRHCSNRA